MNMSSEVQQPISPARFAEALKELPASSLALKVLELRNAIAHLDYSNAELRPFAEGTTPTLDQQRQSGNSDGGGGGGDQDCRDAIAENETVIARMQERIALVRAEVEGRGLSWAEFQGEAPASNPAPTIAGAQTDTTNTTTMVNGHHDAEEEGSSQQQQHEAWRDGTFQTGTISQQMTDEELMAEILRRMPPDDNDRDADGGMHL